MILYLNVEYVLPSGVSDVDDVDDQVVASYWEGWGVGFFFTITDTSSLDSLHVLEKRHLFCFKIFYFHPTEGLLCRFLVYLDVCFADNFTIMNQLNPTSYDPTSL